MYNLHCHSLLSDGVLLPTELARRYEEKGYRVIAITDHVDYSNIEYVIDSILKFIKHWPKATKIKVLSGIELTHLPLGQFKPLARYGRDKGIKIIVGHGETLVEPVIRGTNRAALEAGIDILAHPGLISDADIKLAKKANVFLEITSRTSHSDANYHIVEQALKLEAKLIINTDSHMPEDIISPEELVEIGIKSGLSHKEINKIHQDINKFVKEKEGG